VAIWKTNSCSERSEWQQWKVAIWRTNSFLEGMIGFEPGVDFSESFGLFCTLRRVSTTRAVENRVHQDRRNELWVGVRILLWSQGRRGQTGEPYHMCLLARDTSSGIQAGIWAGPLTAVNKQRSRERGPLIFRTKKQHRAKIWRF
jgi:hypothetical protein